MATIDIDYQEYRRKVLGCWLGKAVGGTLGGPHEGARGPLDLTFYDPVPAQMEGNDDLDLQVVWLQTVRRKGLPVDRLPLAEAWQDCVQTCPDEYGVCRRNLAHGLMPSLSGAYDNGFTDGMGAAIRSEVWACLAPGDPALAADLAREDACVDHAGDGIHAETFFVTIESAAFVRSDARGLIELGLGAIPAGCRVAQAVRAAVEGWDATSDWRAVRERLLADHGGQNFTDVPINLAFTVLGWLAGGGGFGRSICLAVNCGMDTDCTGATLGAILGLIDPGCIGEEWLAPIGRSLVLSPFITGTAAPATLDELADQTADLAQQVLAYYGSQVRLEGAPPVRQPVRHRVPARLGAQVTRRRPPAARSALVATEPVALEVNYPDGVRVAPGKEGAFRVELTNTAEAAADVGVRVHLPGGWTARGPLALEDAVLHPGESTALDLVLAPAEQAWRPCAQRMDLEVRCNGVAVTHSTGLLMTIPVLHWTVDALPEARPAPPADAATVEAQGHMLDLDALADVGAVQAFALRLKMPYEATVRFVAQSARPVRLWLDDERLLDVPGGYEVPAIHRAMHTGADAHLRRGERRLTAAVGPGSAPGARLFLAIGDPGSWRWVEAVEFAGLGD